MNDKQIYNMLEFYKTIDKTMLLYIENVYLPYTGKFTYPKWLQNILSNYLAWQVNRKYNKIQKEIKRLEFLLTKLK